MNRRGRPMKYAAFIKILKPDSLYSSTTVVDNPHAESLFLSEDFEKQDRRKIQNALAQFAKNHLPSEGDGLIEEVGKPPIMGWYGWRWRSAIPSYYFTDKEKRMLRGKKRPRTAPPPNKLLWIFAAVLGISLFSLGAAVSVYSEGLRIFGTQGPRAALAYFQQTTAKRQDYKAEFGKAWSKFSIGKFSEAEEDCYRLIQDSNLPLSVRGNAHYLLGHVHLSRMRLEKANENFFTALGIYQQLDKIPSIFNSSLGLAEVAIEQGLLEQADDILEHALSYEADTDLNLGDFYHLKTKIAFLREDYPYALEMSHESYAEYEYHEQRDGTVNALIDIGFYQILLGFYEEGYESAMLAHEMILKAGIDRQYYFNSANVLLFNKCRQQPIVSLQAQIEQRIHEEGTGELKQLLDFVLQWDCAVDFDTPKTRTFLPEILRGGGGAPVPPPDGQTPGLEEEESFSLSPTGKKKGSDGAPVPPPDFKKGGGGAPNPPPDGRAPGLEKGGDGAPVPPPDARR